MEKIAYYQLNLELQTDRLKPFCNKYIKSDAQKWNVRECKGNKGKG